MRTGEVSDLIRILFKKLLAHYKNLIFNSYRAQILHSVHSTPFEDDRRRGVGAMRLITKAQDIESLLQREKVARISETDEVLCKIHARAYFCPKQPTLP